MPHRLSQARGRARRGDFRPGSQEQKWTVSALQKCPAQRLEAPLHARWAALRGPPATWARLLLSVFWPQRSELLVHLSLPEHPFRLLDRLGVLRKGSVAPSATRICQATRSMLVTQRVELCSRAAGPTSAASRRRSSGATSSRPGVARAPSTMLRRRPRSARAAAPASASCAANFPAHPEAA